MIDVPILFLIFNRPVHAQTAFGKIREIKPRKLYIAADGPRVNNPEDVINCSLTRERILKMVDWDCEVKTLFREQNAGTGKGIFESISWFFREQERGIILEDDCLMDVTFYKFCSTLLDYYQDDKSVMHISGNNFQKKRSVVDSYYFSAFSHNWGWATWRRAWLQFDFYLSGYNKQQLESNLITFYGMDEDEIIFWTNLFDSAGAKLESNIPLTHWDFQWASTIWLNKGLSILPTVNLVKNIGLGEEATHTKNLSNFFKHLETQSITDLSYINEREINRVADRFTFDNYYHPKKSNSFFQILKNKLRANQL